MRKNIARVAVAVAVGCALSAAGVSRAGAAGTAPVARPAERLPHALPAERVSHALPVPGAKVPAPGTRLWVKRFNSSGKRDDAASSVAVSPGGGRVFVTGSSTPAGAGAGPGNYVTVAYRTATGAQLWSKRYNGPGTSWDAAAAVAVSPDNRTVFVTGFSNRTQGGPGDYATVAYNAATGAQRWVERYSGPGNGSDGATSLAVSPGGKIVFVTGFSGGPKLSTPPVYATVAYNASTGARLWAKRYRGPGGSGSGASAVAVSPRGGRVFVTGSSDNDYATVAYRATTGARLWVKRYPGPSNPRDDGGATAVTVSPAGATVFVTGTSSGPGVNSTTGYATIAYRAGTGAQLWAASYNGPAGGSDRASSIAASPRGDAVFVTGASDGDFGTVAYDAASGAQRWARQYNGPGNLDDFARSIAVSQSGTSVFVTGPSVGATRHYDYATVAYNAATGAQRWARRYNGLGNGGDPAAVGVSPRGDGVFVTGGSPGHGTGGDYATIAYRG
jgi:WD40 repeat protein